MRSQFLFKSTCRPNPSLRRTPGLNVFNTHRLITSRPFSSVSRQQQGVTKRQHSFQNTASTPSRQYATPVTLHTHSNVTKRHYSQSSQDTYSKEEHRRMLSLVRAYRQYGYHAANIDPLGINKPKSVQDIFELKPSVHGLHEVWQAEQSGDFKYFDVGMTVHVGGKTRATLTEIIEFMQRVYCNKTACQFYHLQTLKEIEWVAAYMEREVEPLSSDDKRRAHRLMLESQLFDDYLQKKFPSVKRYGAEGSEAFLPVMDTLFKMHNKNGVEDIVLGMPHRGRLNLLTGLLKFPPRAMFHKMMGNCELPEDVSGTGDVLSHLGICSSLDYGLSHPVAVSLLNNPSHLEAVNSVAQGKCRSRITKGLDSATILVHGDSAICAQGNVFETLQLCNLPHFTVNGIVHVIVNNQLGFTTSPKHYRSTAFSADVGKIISAPLFTVNAESLDDVIRVTKLCADFKAKFNKDSFIELLGYRRYGHQHLDEPSFTQPLMYKNIRSRKTYPELYTEQMIEEGIIDSSVAKAIKESREEFLNSEYDAAPKYTPDSKFFLGDIAAAHASNNRKLVTPSTGYEIKKLREIGYNSVKVPENFNVHPRLNRSHIEARLSRLNASDNEPVVDWALAEACAVGSLLQEGFSVRLSGQDSSRGTFSQRFFKLIDQENEARHFVFSDLPEKVGRLEVVSSPLSEFGVLGFEYGYSIDDTKTLVIFENQFGDFQNNAQCIFDCFIANSEDKWVLPTGITCLLPHGYDGAGPDHSSCRIERFLQQCNIPINRADAKFQPFNMYVINPSTPSQYFHALRRQMKQSFRKPLIVVAPKILLRHASCVSSFDELGPGTKFKSVLSDTVKPHKNMKKLLLCSGKIFYDLDKLRTDRGLQDRVAIIRIEELSPFPFEAIEKEVMSYLDEGCQFESVAWIQEEHENQGAYTFVMPRLKNVLRLCNVDELEYIGRGPLSCSAVGVAKFHKQEVQTLMNGAFAGVAGNGE